MATTLNAEYFDKFFLSGISTYTLYETTGGYKVVHPIQRPDLGMTYESGIIIRPQTDGYADGLGIAIPAVVTTLSVIDVWVVVRAWKSNHLMQASSMRIPFTLHVGFHSDGINPPSAWTYKDTMTRNLMSERGWQTMRLRHQSGGAAWFRIAFETPALSGIVDPFMVVDSWGYEVVL